jgi:hypothetical protein
LKKADIINGLWIATFIIESRKQGRQYTAMRMREHQQIVELRSALFWAIMRRRVVIVYRRFGTTYRSHFTGQESEYNYHTTPRNIPEERRSHQHHGGSVKSWN